ncbi:MAG: FIST N-terminal domain-containing protein [Leptospirales bacterium]|jgi:hypothetical protein
MQSTQAVFTEESGWRLADPTWQGGDLVLVFGSRERMEDPQTIDDLRRLFGDAILFGCSTAGEIEDSCVLDDSVVATAIRFERASVRVESAALPSVADSYQVARSLAQSLDREDLKHVLVLAEGLRVNGSALSRGLRDGLSDSVSVTGGLSGDSDRFARTLVLAGEGAAENRVAVLGLYGAIRTGCASLGGWDCFGPERRVTRSEGSVLYELDGKSALEIYKRYLGEHSANLPASALLFPLSLRTPDVSGIVRTILSVDEERGSMTFAGDIPEGALARLMIANFEHLIDGAQSAADLSRTALRERETELALLVSCVGRKLILKGRVDEEIEAVRRVLGPGPVLAGFYSYGEISPFTPSGKCELHNQTMTITTLAEVD